MSILEMNNDIFTLLDNVTKILLALTCREFYDKFYDVKAPLMSIQMSSLGITLGMWDSLTLYVFEENYALCNKFWDLCIEESESLYYHIRNQYVNVYHVNKRPQFSRFLIRKLKFDLKKSFLRDAIGHLDFTFIRWLHKHGVDFSPLNNYRLINVKDKRSLAYIDTRGCIVKTLYYNIYEVADEVCHQYDMDYDFKVLYNYIDNLDFFDGHSFHFADIIKSDEPQSYLVIEPLN